MAKKNKLPLPRPVTDDRISDYIHKAVDFVYHGCRLRFLLCQALFSSFDIDDGTRLLLKTIAGNIDCSRLKQVLDLGCGTGIIGICLQKKHPGLQMHFTDRDALALAFTRENTALNKTDPADITGKLGIEKIDSLYDLVVSNIPAKAGEPVIADLVKRSLASLAGNGICAFVVINALAPVLSGIIRDIHAQIILEEKTTRYTVLHVKCTKPSATGNSFLAPYIRNEGTFQCRGVVYQAATVYNLPDFDTISFRAEAAAKILHREALTGRCLIWNPGQGHIPLYITGKTRQNSLSFSLAGRDLLQLYISSQNLLATGMDRERIQILHKAFLSDLSGEYDYVILFPDIIPGVTWEREIWQSLPGLLALNGKTILTVKNSCQHRLLTAADGFRIMKKIKHKTFTSVLAMQK